LIGGLLGAGTNRDLVKRCAGIVAIATFAVSGVRAPLRRQSGAS